MDEDRREERRRLTRDRIASTAMHLFLERGFDRVSVAEIAHAAGVTEKTIYNHFGTKAGLFFDESDDLLDELLHAVRTRDDGESAIDAVASYFAGIPEWAGHRRPTKPSSRFRAVIADSPALQAAQRAMFARYERALAEELANQTGDSPRSVEQFVAAVALVGAIRATFEAEADEAGTERGRRALDFLATGLREYARRCPKGQPQSTVEVANDDL